MKMLITTIDSIVLAAPLTFVQQIHHWKDQCGGYTDNYQMSVFLFKSYQNGIFESIKCSRSLSFLYLALLLKLSDFI